MTLLCGGKGERTRTCSVAPMRHEGKVSSGSRAEEVEHLLMLSSVKESPLTSCQCFSR